MPQIVPLLALPSQTFLIDLNQQTCRIDVYQKRTGMFCNFWLGNGSAPTLAGRICLDRTLIVRDAYLGFSGDLAFFDAQGTSDPTYDGLGTRYFLYYLSPADLAS
jgi:hypothetical protein